MLIARTTIFFDVHALGIHESFTNCNMSESYHYIVKVAESYHYIVKVTESYHYIVKVTVSYHYIVKVTESYHYIVKVNGSTFLEDVTSEQTFQFM